MTTDASEGVSDGRTTASEVADQASVVKKGIESGDNVSEELNPGSASSVRLRSGWGR